MDVCYYNTWNKLIELNGFHCINVRRYVTAGFGDTHICLLGVCVSVHACVKEN